MTADLLVAPDDHVLYEGTFVNGNGNPSNGPLPGPVDVSTWTGALIELVGSIAVGSGLELSVVHYDGIGFPIFSEVLEIGPDLSSVGGSVIAVPFHGAQCAITYATLGGTQNITLRTWLTRRPMMTQRIHSVGLPGALGTSNGQPGGILLGQSALAVANLTSSTLFRLPFWVGWAEMVFSLVGATTNGQAWVDVLYADSTGAVRSSRRFWLLNPVAPNLDVNEKLARLWLPGGGMTAQITNQSQGAATYDLSILATPT